VLGSGVMVPPSPDPRWFARLLLLAAVALAGRSPCVWGEAASEARTPAEVYERRANVSDCLAYVARDLKTRAGTPAKGDSILLLVVDATTSLAGEVAELAAGLDGAFREGPRGLHIGVLAVGGDVTPPSMIPTRAKGALEALRLVPVEGVKNLLEAVRDGATLLTQSPGTGPRALMLVTEEGGDGEDDIEATRAALLETGVAFYALAGEAAFERGWAYDFEARKDPGAGWVERYSPEPKKREASLYFGGEVAYGLVPYRWELDLAQTEFLWAQPPRYPVPSGFGYWPLASLAYTSGGRYFLHDFTQAALPEARAARRKTLYDVSRLALLAPDLRPRARILKDLAKDGRSRVIVRIWEQLADEALPLLQDLGTLELTASGLAVRPGRPVRSAMFPALWYEDGDDLEKAREYVTRRVTALDQSLTWWAQENAKAREEAPGTDPLRERIEANFQLLGAQLRRARFHLGEAQAAQASIRPLDVTQRRARIVPVPLAILPAEIGQRPAPDLGDPERNARLADLLATLTRIGSRYAGTPWALILEKSWLISFKKDVQIVEPEEEPPARPTKPEDGKGKGQGKMPPPGPPAPPPAPPPAGPRPGSGGAGPTSGR